MQSDCKKVTRARGNALPGNFAVALMLMSLLAASAWAQGQGVRYDNIVLGPNGRPVASAQIAVCTAAAVSSTTPCSPLAQVYSDQALTQPMANPFTADSLGNYGFWAEPGQYVVQIYGTGVTPRTMDVFLACDPSNCTMTSATVSSITAGTLNLTGSLTVDGRSVATEPLPSDAVQYVSPNGNDSSSGLSWGSAKQTLYAAVSDLEGANGGTVYVAPNTACGGPVSGQGLWLAGSGDPQYSSLPSGWIQFQHSLKIVGVGVVSNGVAQNNPAPAATISCGTSATAGAAIWLSDITWASTLEIDNIAVQTPAQNALRLGIASNGSRTSSGDSDLVFNNDSFGVDAGSTEGPAIDIGSNVFWDRFNNLGVSANSSAAPLSDAHQAIVVNPTASGTDSELLFFNHVVADYGGLHYYADAPNNGGSLSVRDLTTESVNDTSPAVWITEDNSYGYYDISQVQVADPTESPTYAVKVDGTDPLAADATVRSSEGGVSGPMTLLGGLNETPEGSQSPLASGQTGNFGGRLWGPVNNGDFTFGMADVPFPNLIPTNPANWNYNNSGGALTATISPDGTDDAWETIGSPTGDIFLYDGTTTYSVGDYIIFSSWIRNPGGYNGFSSGFNISFVGGGCTDIQVPAGQSVVDGLDYTGTNWKQVEYVYRVTTGGSCELRIQWPHGGSWEQTAFFEPMYLHVPASDSFTDDDAIGLALQLQGVPNGLSAGTVATWPGHDIAFGGSGDPYFATLDHTALTANQTFDFPNQSGTIGLVLSGTTGSIGGSALAAGACTTGTAAISGASSSMAVAVSPAADPGPGFTWEGWISTAGTATVRVCNVSGASATPGAESYNVRVIQ